MNSSLAQEVALHSATGPIPALSAPTQFDVVRGRAAFDRTIAELAQSCEVELLSMTPGLATYHSARLTRQIIDLATASGATARTVVEHGATHDEKGQLILGRCVGERSQLRVTPVTPARGWIIDGHTAALVSTAARSDRSPRMIVLHERAIVDWLTGSFEKMWSASIPISEISKPNCGLTVAEIMLAPVRVRVLRLMAEGEKDEVIARRLNISVRTCRRHIADYLERVGATSRFQAGVIAARSGHLDVDPLSDPINW